MVTTAHGWDPDAAIAELRAAREPLVLAGTAFESMMVKDGIDLTSVEGASTLPYAIAHMSVELHSPKQGVPVLWWRSVGSTHTAFSTETFIDELAVAAGKDPVEYRVALLGKSKRHKDVLELVAKKANWGSKPPAGRARGVGVVFSYGSYAATVAEVSVARDGTPRVHKLITGIDAGMAVNPDQVKAQMEGGAVYALTNLDAPRFRLVKIDPAQPQPDAWKAPTCVRCSA